MKHLPFIHKIENLISTARSNKVAVLLGLQELPQLKQLQGKDTATTITAVIGNVISGSVRNKETLDWLERLLERKTNRRRLKHRPFQNIGIS